MRKPKRFFTNEEIRKIIDYYMSGHSTQETGVYFGRDSGTISYILKKNNIPARSVAEGNSLKWENDDFRNNQIQKRVGKPSGALGKNWTIDYPVKKPNLRGDKNHFWKGGKTKLSLAIRELPEYRFWRQNVFQRDGFECKLCNRKRKAGDRVIIQADHIIPLSMLIETHNITSLEDAAKCQELWDINNGRTLCKECHKKTRTYGVNKHKQKKTICLGVSSLI